MGREEALRRCTNALKREKRKKEPTGVPVKDRHAEALSCSSWVLHCTGASKIVGVHLVQPLWGGLGELLRLELTGGAINSAILKRVLAPEEQSTNPSMKRKWHSYQVEQRWYEKYSKRCEQVACRTARWYGNQAHGRELFLLLEDLGVAGFVPQKCPTRRHLQLGLEWLARFHALFMFERPEELWKRGTYWNLPDRLDELERTTHPWFKAQSRALDRALKGARFQTVVHGDSKASNFLWRNLDEAAAVDFQWVGPGCGMRDVTLLLDRCLGEEGCMVEADHWLNHYFESLQRELLRHQLDCPWEALEAEWRRLYPIAWCDHERLWQGWGQGRPSLGPYTRHLMMRSSQVLNQA